MVLYALAFIYKRLVSPICPSWPSHPYALPSPSCTFLQLYTPAFKRRLFFFTYTHFHSPIHLCLFISVHFSLHFSNFRQLYALVFFYMRLLSLMCSFQTVLSPIVVFWLATYSGGSAVISAVNPRLVTNTNWHLSLKSCQQSDNIRVFSRVDGVNVVGVAIQPV